MPTFQVLLNLLPPSYISSKLMVHILGAVCYNEVPHQHQGCSHICLWHPGMLTNPVLSQILFVEFIIPPCVFFLYLHFTAGLLTFNSLYQRACLQNHCLLPPSYSVSHLNKYNWYSRNARRASCEVVRPMHGSKRDANTSSKGKVTTLIYTLGCVC